MATTINTEQHATEQANDSHGAREYNWQYILEIAKKHKRQLIMANIIAVIATLASVPVPLLMPLLVDEVLLNQPGVVVNSINAITPSLWHGPSVVYINYININFMLASHSISFECFSNKTIHYHC